MTTYSRAGEPAPRPTYQPLPQALHLRDLAAAEARADAIYQCAISTMPGDAAGRETGEWQLQDLERALEDARGLVERARYQENAARMTAELEARQAAEQIARDRLTERDPEVIAARETLKRLNSSALQLLMQSDNLSAVQKVAATGLLKERADEALAKATTGSAPSAQPAAAA